MQAQVVSSSASSSASGNLLRRRPRVAAPAAHVVCSSSASASMGPLACAHVQQQQQWITTSSSIAAPSRSSSSSRSSRRRAASTLARDARAPAPPPALASASVDEDAGGPAGALGPDAAEAVAYALQFAAAGETYEVHAWMLLLALLKAEGAPAARALKRAGLDDLYGAWHEVLWALNAADGLEPRAFAPQVSWAPGAYKVVTGAARFAGWAGRAKVAGEDVLLALAAAGSLEALFPDLDLSFASVRRAIEAETGVHYKLPDDDGGDAAAGAAGAGQDLFV